jgi:hypothetical protein
MMFLRRSRARLGPRQLPEPRRLSSENMLRAKFNAASTGANYVSLVLAESQIREETLSNLRRLLEDWTHADTNERSQSVNSGDDAVNEHVVEVLAALAYRPVGRPVVDDVRGLLSLLDDVTSEALVAAVARLDGETVDGLLRYLESVGIGGKSAGVVDGSVLPGFEHLPGPMLTQSARVLHAVLEPEETTETTAVQAYRTAVRLPAIVLAAGLSASHALLNPIGRVDLVEPTELTKLLDTAARLLDISEADIARESLALDARQLSRDPGDSSGVAHSLPRLTRERVIVEAVARLGLPPRGRYNVACFLTGVGDFEQAFDQLASAIVGQPALRSFAVGDPSLKMLARHDPERWTLLLVVPDRPPPSNAN